MSKKIVGYFTDKTSGEPRAKLFFEKEGYTLEQVKEWFANAGFQEPEAFINDDDEIVLFINYRVNEQSDDRPKDARLVDAINIFKEQGLALPASKIRSLYKEYSTVKAAFNTAKETDKDNWKVYLNAYQGAFLGLAKYFNEELVELFKNQLSTLEEDEKDVVNDQIEIWDALLDYEDEDHVEDLFDILEAALEADHKDIFYFLLNDVYKLFGGFVRAAVPLIGGTTLHVAVKNGRDWAVEPLLELGVDKRIKDKDGKTAFDYYKEDRAKRFLKISEDDDIAKMLNPHEEITNIIEGLKQVCPEGDEYYKQMIQVFHYGLDGGMGGQEVDRAITLARILIHAILNEHDEVFNFIVNSKDVKEFYPQIFNRQDDGDGYIFPLLTAIFKRNLAQVKKLIECGADYNSENASGKTHTPLTYAVSYGDNKNIEVIKFLIDKVDNIDLAGPSDTALHYAAMGDVDALNALLEAGAAFNVANDRGEMPHDVAREDYFTKTTDNKDDMLVILRTLMEKADIFDFSKMTEEEINECVTWDIRRIRDFRLDIGLDKLKAYREVSEENDRLITTWLSNKKWFAKVDPIVKWNIYGLIEKLEKPEQKISEKEDSEKVSESEDQSTEKSEEDKKEEQWVQKAVFELFNADQYLENYQGDPITQANFVGQLKGSKYFPVELIDKIHDQWTAFGKSKMTSDAVTRHMAEFIETVNGEHVAYLNIETLTPDTKIALQNLFAYGGKLMAEANFRDEALQNKIDHAADFLRAVFTQEELTTDSIREAYETLERNDQNRGSGFYRVHTFFTGKRYTDEKGHSRLVKSTLGELAHDVFKAVERAEKDKEHEAEESVRSSGISNIE